MFAPYHHSHFCYVSLFFNMIECVNYSNTSFCHFVYVNAKSTKGIKLTYQDKIDASVKRNAANRHSKVFFFWIKNIFEMFVVHEQSTLNIYTKLRTSANCFRMQRIYISLIYSILFQNYFKNTILLKHTLSPSKDALQRQIVQLN